MGNIVTLIGLGGLIYGIVNVFNGNFFFGGIIGVGGFSLMVFGGKLYKSEQAKRLAEEEAIYNAKQCPQCGSRQKRKGRDKVRRFGRSKTLASSTSGEEDRSADYDVEYIEYRTYLVCKQCDRQYDVGKSTEKARS